MRADVYTYTRVYRYSYIQRGGERHAVNYDEPQAEWEPLAIIRQRGYSSLKSYPSFYQFASVVHVHTFIFSEKTDVFDPWKPRVL